MLWSDKHRPTKHEDLVGNPTAVKRLHSWLSSWENVHINKTEKKAFSKENEGASAVLISGPPGIGKSTTAALIAQQLGYEILELNASDARSKKSIQALLGDTTGSSVISFAPVKGASGSASSSSSTAGFFGKSNVQHQLTTKKKRVIIMDEVDGMSGSDRGGIQELIKIIKTTKSPIICICNDRQKSSVRSLANHCFDLKFQRPVPTSIAKFLRGIADKEGLRVDDESLEIIAKNNGNDIRQAINAMQMWRRTSKKMTADDIKARQYTMSKDSVLRLSSFDAASFIFNTSHQSPLHLRFDAYFVDYDLIPLMIAENCAHATKNKISDDIEQLERLSNASDAVCDADICAKYVRGDMCWDLLTTQAVMNIRAAYISNGQVPYPGFPEWLGRNSNATRRQRLLGDMAMHIRKSASTDRKSLRTDYFDVLRSRLLQPLIENSSSSDPKKGLVEESVKMLLNYGCSRDDLFEGMQEIKFPNFPDDFSKVDTKTKSAFTRLYNKMCEEEEVVSKKGKKAKAAIDFADYTGEVPDTDDAPTALALDNGLEDEEADEDGEENEAGTKKRGRDSNEEDEAAQFRKKSRKAPAAKSQKSASASSSSSSKKKPAAKAVIVDDDDMDTLSSD